MVGKRKVVILLQGLIERIKLFVFDKCIFNPMLDRSVKYLTS